MELDLIIADNVAVTVEYEYYGVSVHVVIKAVRVGGGDLYHALNTYWDQYICDKIKAHHEG